jgi:uncharacterized membrane protein
MKYCDICKVKILSKNNKCPLCHNELRDKDDSVETYPKFEVKKNYYTKAARIISSVSPILIAISIVINIFTWRGKLWSAITSACIIYFWLLGLLTFNRKIHLGLKLISHAITIPLVLMVINAFATSSHVISRITWAISYATPFIILVFISAINFIMIKRKHRFQDYLLYQFSLCFMAFIPLIIALCGLAKPLYPSVGVALCAIITILDLIIFEKKIVKAELGRKFHV